MGYAPELFQNRGRGAAYPRKKGYAKRYVRSQLGKNRLNLALGVIFLLGAVTGSSIAGRTDSGVVETLTRFFSAGNQNVDFLTRVLSSFGANTLLLLILFLCGLGAVFQPIVILVLFWRGMGFGALGVYAYSTGQSAEILRYLLVTMPEAVLMIFLLVAAARESLRFSIRFFVRLLPESTLETLPNPQGNIAGYLAKFLVFYLLGGTLALISGVLGILGMV